MRRGKLLCIMSLAALLSAGMTLTAMADWSQTDGNWYYYHDRTGQLIREDWVESSGKWYYMGENGVMQTNAMIDDMYYVNSAGEMVTDTWVYLNESWTYEGGWRYFGSNGRICADGWRTIGDARYHFSNSVMDTGWYHDGGDTYYLGTSGAMATGWKEIWDEDDWDECWYYFGSNGKMVSGTERSISNEGYIFNADGKMLTGWVNPSDYSSSGREDLSTTNIEALKYYKSGGQRADGWVYLLTPDEHDEGWFYFDDGQAYTAQTGTTATGAYGFARIKGETYCFDSRGLMVTGLVEISDGRIFYFDPAGGQMRTGRVVVNDDDHDNEIFYFTTTGTLGNKGEGVTGVKDGYLYEDGNLVQAEEGMKYEKVTVAGQDYVVNEQGRVRTSGTVTDNDGVKYKIEKQSDGTYQITVTE